MHFCKHNNKCDQKISHNVNDYIPKARDYDFERIQKIYIINSYSLIFWQKCHKYLFDKICLDLISKNQWTEKFINFFHLCVYSVYI